ncbi:MAG: hypothetical protein EHM81_02310 [Chloroflexi bacterium]|nr:MAG: hypothetical protein EHM81_02310 [Chloroflexota bacterium]
MYEQAGLPSLNVGASAPEVTQNRPWAFRLINNTTDLGKYAALYARDVLGYETASVVYEDNNFGNSLAGAFKATFQQNGGTIAYYQPIAGIPAINADGLEVAQQVVRAIAPADGQKPGLVFLAVTLNAAHEMVLANHALDAGLTMLASYAMGDAHFAQRFDNPAVLDGFYAMSLLNFDVAGEAAQKFFNDYTAAYGSAPSWHSGTTYDAFQVALRALQATGASGAPVSLSQERQQIRDFLAVLDSPGQALDGVRGQIYFDASHNFSPPPTFGLFQQGQFIPAPVQLRPVQNRKLVDPAASSIIADGGQYIYKTSVAYTGIRLNEITNIDVDKTHTFTADFYIWFRYQGDLDVGDIDFLNAAEPVQLDAPVAAATQNGLNYRLYRVRAPFRTTFDLQNYPFDRQELAIQFRHRVLTNEKLIYVADAAGMDGLVHGPDLLARLIADNVFASDTDWQPANPRIFIAAHANTSSFGNPLLLGDQQKVESSTFNLKVDILRNYGRFAFKNILPLFFIVALAYLSLFLPEYKFESAISVMTGSLLSIVFFHVNLSSSLNVGYSVALDYIFYATYLLFTLEVLILVLAWHRQQKDEKMARNYMLLARAFYPAYILLGSLLFLWIFVARLAGS